MLVKLTRTLHEILSLFVVRSAQFNRTCSLSVLPVDTHHATHEQREQLYFWLELRGASGAGSLQEVEKLNLINSYMTLLIPDVHT